ncbi:MAG: aminotransferase class I/II-fold pyridoxal phosphate-dependent enzyme [Bacteroidales bacterium]|nr:aminotransferase class I/II-fold pyridoxal phosphate-dependent enzyme [Bacteroidales bacterium]MCF8328472.1 aminotransferase class I/II-fold pyridoxal phosphate-dependent enzyme [Bacteroidales bacterium]
MAEEKQIWLSSPHMSGYEREMVEEAFDTNWIAPVGPHINAFEEELAQYLKQGKVAVLSSGTAAIHLALIMLDVKSGDEVLVSSLTFSGSVNPVVYQGAVPVFVDSEKETWNMDPQLLEEAINDRIKKGKKPKAIVTVHLYGMPAKMDEITAIAKKYEIPLIEDAAESIGSEYKGQKTGSFGEISILSFNGNKIITTSGGGALVSRNEEYVKLAKKLSTQARDEAPHYQHSMIGYNYRMSNVLAGIGRGQMKVLDERVNQRRRINQFYRELLEGYSHIEFLNEPRGHYSNYWLTTILMRDEENSQKPREYLRTELQKHKIECRPLWKPMHLQPVFMDYPAYTNGTSEELFDVGLCLPSGTNMSDEDLQRISSRVKEILG